MSKKIIFFYFLILVAFLGLGFFLFRSSQTPPTDLPGQTLENQEQQHIAEGSTDHPPYNSNPPTSGWHWPKPASWGVYDTTQPDEQLIHNLEHGGVWISYKDVDQQTVDQLKDFAKRYRKVIVEPRMANDAKISLAAWGHLQNLDAFEETTILRFIGAFYDKGPEKAD